MIKILFLCTGNSCRSQMAEGWARQIKTDTIEAYSADIETHGLNSHAVQVMAEVGVDMTGQQSQNVEQLNPIDFDYVITVYDNATSSRPVFPGKAKVVHQPFDDPPRLTREAATEEEEGLNQYRRVRDEIRRYIESLPQILTI
ncbi:MAG: arsenate reductase ArsC [Pirellulales bacterium]